MQGTLKEAVLMKVMQREEALADLRTVLGYRSASLDPADQDQINSFNKLIGQYNEIKDPSLKREREAHFQSKKEQMDSLKDLDMSKIKFSNKKMKTNKIKIL